MPRRPEIGNVQLYPNRPLRAGDRNGYVLKFYCPILRTRIRKNCGTRDRREARRVQRDCRERLLNGEYVASGGAITAGHASASARATQSAYRESAVEGRSWQECYQRFREHRTTRIRERSLGDIVSRLQIAERILEGYRADRGLSEGLVVSEVMTLDMLEYLQDRLLAGDECRYDRRSPNTVNSMMAAVMAFVRFCHGRSWIASVPPVERLDVDDVMKGRPITTEEFERMLEVTPAVVGASSADSWRFALRILWESGFRVGDLMDFSWDDEGHIHPVWTARKGQHPTIIVPSTQKNGRHQEIPMLPGLEALLQSVPESQRRGWIVRPLPVEYGADDAGDRFRPTIEDLESLTGRFSNRSIAAACGVTDTAVRRWLAEDGVSRRSEFKIDTGSIDRSETDLLRSRAIENPRPFDGRFTKEHVGRIISRIGKEARIVVRQLGGKGVSREKFASAHDLRRGCAQRLINLGVSAETLKVVFRHESFSTTERFYGAKRSAQSAAAELVAKLMPVESTPALVGGLVGGRENGPRLSAAEVQKLKALLNSL